MTSPHFISTMLYEQITLATFECITLEIKLKMHIEKCVPFFLPSSDVLSGTFALKWKLEADFLVSFLIYLNNKNATSQA